MRTENYDNGFAGGQFAGLIAPASSGLVELLIAAGHGLTLVARGIAFVATKVASLGGDAGQAPHVALLQVPGEFVAGTWRRV